MEVEENKYKKLQSVFWDYKVNPEKLYEIVSGKKAGGKFLNKEKILLRILERMSWYEVKDLLGKEYLKENLSEELINKIRNHDLRKKYEFIKKVLREEVVSFTGWSDKNRKRLKSSILSDRRYST